MDRRPEYPMPADLPPALAQLMVAKAATRTVWVNAEGVPFWLLPERAAAIHARHGGQLFPPEPAAG
jgi:hypothetical protein